MIVLREFLDTVISLFTSMRRNLRNAVFIKDDARKLFSICTKRDDTFR